MPNEQAILERLKSSVFQINNGEFDRLALEMFKFQYGGNPLYRAYTDALGIDPEQVKGIPQIPFLPIGFFKTHRIVCGDFRPQEIFESSGTSSDHTSSHEVRDLGVYRESFRRGFELRYGDITDYVVLALLPSYLERSHSSLVFMVDDLINSSEKTESGFYLHDHDRLYQQLLDLESSGRKTLLIGVSFALLDFCEKYQMQLRHTIVMETGGMKGRRREITREELHQILIDRLGLELVDSEYGMTELLSQAYSQEGGRFSCPPWMRIMVREEDDPVLYAPCGTPGGINVIDLANLHSCAFIATDDIGICREDGTFEVTGRLDQTALRGCSLMVVDGLQGRI